MNVKKVNESISHRNVILILETGEKLGTVTREEVEQQTREILENFYVETTSERVRTNDNNTTIS